MAIQMDDDDGLGARRQDGFDGGAGKREDMGVDVGEDGRGPLVEDGRGRGDEGVSGHDDLILGADAGRRQGQMDGGGAGAGGHAVLDAVIFSEGGLKAGHCPAAEAGQAAGAQDLGHGLGVFLARGRPRREGRPSDGLTPFDGQSRRHSVITQGPRPYWTRRL